MFGYKALKYLREKGLKPANCVTVWFDDLVKEQRWWRYEDTIGDPEIVIRTSEVIELLDLRALTGLHVLAVCGEWSHRFDALVTMIEAVNPSSLQTISIEDVEPCQA